MAHSLISSIHSLLCDHFKCCDESKVRKYENMILTAIYSSQFLETEDKNTSANAINMISEMVTVKILTKILNIESVATTKI